MWWRPQISKPKKFAHKKKHLEKKKRFFFSRFSAFLHLDGHILVIRLIVKKDFGKKNANLEKIMEATDFETEKVCPQS